MTSVFVTKENPESAAWWIQSGVNPGFWSWTGRCWQAEWPLL